MTADVTFHC